MDIRTKIGKAIVGVTLAALIAGGAALATPASPASAEVYGGPYGRKVGGVNFDAFCRSEGWAGAQLLGWSAGNWKCYSDISGTVQIHATARAKGGEAGVQAEFQIGRTIYGSINADKACQFTWQDRSLIANFVNWYDPYSIICINYWG